MKYKWLNRKYNEKLIVFFNGWGMDESVVKHLKPEDYDVIMFYDYNSLDCNIDLANYKEKYLVAWSMGVMTATLFDFGYKSKTAVNGTLKPVDNEFGIPVKVYDLTLKHLNPEKFMQNMFLPGEKIPEINRDFENQKNELAALKTYKANGNFRYERLIISSCDKIIPVKNQIRYWGINANLESGHCPFYKFSFWSELL